MPKSRKRKVRRGGSSSRSAHSAKKRTSQTTKLIVWIIIAGLAVATLLFIVLRNGGGGSTSGGQSSAPGAEVTTASGLKYIDEVVGTGASPKTGQTVTVHYTGTLENGKKFDSSLDRGQPYTFRLGVNPVIQGWVEGLSTMKAGGKRKLIIPPSLGYGAEGNGPTIPPNATLLFDIELLSVQ